HYDVIVIPDIAERQIIDGHRPGTIPERYAGGLGEEGVQELRDLVAAGGTPITFNNASIFAINPFTPPVADALAGLRPDQALGAGGGIRQGPRDSAGIQAAVAGPIARGV